jgi:hypothetical protein
MSQGEYIIILFIFMFTHSSNRHTMTASCRAAFLSGMTRNRDQQIHRPRSIFSRQAPYPPGRILDLALIRGRASRRFPIPARTRCRDRSRCRDKARSAAGSALTGTATRFAAAVGGCAAEFTDDDRPRAADARIDRYGARGAVAGAGAAFHAGLAPPYEGFP